MEYSDGLKTQSYVPINKNILRCLYFNIKNNRSNKRVIRDYSNKSVMLHMESPTFVPYGDDDKILFNLLGLYFSNKKHYSKTNYFRFSSINALGKALNITHVTQPRLILSLNRLASVNLLFTRWYKKRKSDIIKTHICSFGMKNEGKVKTVDICVSIDEILLKLADTKNGFWEYINLDLFNTLSFIERRAYMFLLAFRKNNVIIDIKQLARTIGLTNVENRKHNVLEREICKAFKKVVESTLLFDDKHKVLFYYYYSPSFKNITLTFGDLEDSSNILTVEGLGFNDKF